MLDPDISTADALAHLQVAETDPLAMDRRRFLQLLGMGAGAGLLAGPGSSLLDHAFGHDPSAWAAGPIGANDGIVVIIGMFGGNDGLNTVVPYDDGSYRDQHGSLAIDGTDTLPIGNGAGLNKSLTEFKKFWDAGQLAVVEGVGYPNPDLSHFNSMAYWMAGRPNAIPTSGWIGRWLDGYLGNSPDLYAAADIGTSVPLHLVGRHHRGTAVPATRPSFGASTEARDVRKYQAIRAMRTGSQGPWHGAVGQAFVDQLDLAARLSPIIPDELPETGIVARLEVAARLINANLGFRVLSAGFGDFDSHAGQPAQHGDRMAELNAAVRRFYQVLGARWSNRVTIMTFSEFGRTTWDNDGAGTDHGTSAPHFVLGANVRGGRYGQQPSMAGLQRWERMDHHVDFRSYYASVIDGWLGGGSSDVLGGNYENLGLFERAPGVAPTGPTPIPGVVVPPGKPTGARSSFVPVTPSRVCDTREGLGARKGKVGAGKTISVKVAGVGGVPKSGATAVVANVTAVDATQPMYFTVSPGSTQRGDTSSLNAGPGRPVPNLVVMAIGADGCIDVFNSHGTTHCLVDVFGYFTAANSAGGGFVPTSPSRLFDTRDGTGGVPRGKIRDASPIDVQVGGRGGVPKSGATAVVMNLTVTGTETPGWLRATPTGTRAATTSNVNFFAGDTVPNLTVCKLGTGGRITVDSVGAGTHALGDVFGYFTDDGDQLQPISPIRLLDTRDGTGAPKQQIGPSYAVQLTVGGRGGIPPTATAVVLNVTATNVAAASYVTVWPDGEKVPSTSNLNVVPGQTIANLVVCRLGTDGRLAINNPVAGCDVIADAVGYFVTGS